MPTSTIQDATVTYSIGVTGGMVGTVGGADILAIISGVLITTRFIYDTIRFYYFMKDRKTKTRINKRVKKKE